MPHSLRLALLSLLVVAACARPASSLQPQSARELKSIKIVTEASRLAVGGTQEIIAVGVYSDGARLELTRELKWTSSDPTLLEVFTRDDGQPGVRAKKEGVVMVQVYLGDDSAAIPVHVTGA